MKRISIFILSIFAIVIIILHYVFNLGVDEVITILVEQYSRRKRQLDLLEGYFL